MRTWRVDHPGQRIALRLLALGYPLVVFPALVALCPFRAEQPFQDGVALLAGRRWGDVTFLGVGLFDLFVWAFGALGAALLLADLLPFVWRLRADRPPRSTPDPETAAALAAVLGEVAARARIPPPELHVLDRDAPVLFCTGVRRHALVVSRGALRLLDAAELRAAIGHELAHLSRHDPGSSWAILAARTVMFFNPAFQVVSRAIARESERLADERGAALAGDRLALASALLKLFRATARSRPAGERPVFLAGALSEPLARIRARDVEARCRRLLDGPAPRVAFGGARVVLAGLSLSALLFFVV